MTPRSPQRVRDDGEPERSARDGHTETPRRQQEGQGPPDGSGKRDWYPATLPISGTGYASLKTPGYCCVGEVGSAIAIARFIACVPSAGVSDDGVILLDLQRGDREVFDSPQRRETSEASSI
jgi:hypothetical protein